MSLNNDYQKTLNEKLLLNEYLNTEEIKTFYEAIDKFLSRKKINMAAFIRRLDETLELLKFLDFEYYDCLKIIAHYPSIVQANKKDYFTKYLILASLGINEETKQEYRNEIMIEHSKYMIIGHKTLYARFRFLENRGSKYLTRYYLLKMTNQEFHNTFRLANDELIAKYPFNDDAFNYLLKMPENKKFEAKVKKYTLGGKK